MMKPCLFLLAAACCGVLAAGETPEPPAPPWGKLILGPDTTVPEVIGHVMPHHVPAVLSSYRRGIWCFPRKAAKTPPC